ncbi:hypothetical protein FPL22_05115 [Rariglobus hedericola]|uniref:Uncharacterized protein n=1 Tax=Rariglobus hedericola TaxID=2597822 RepID=A0A556QSX3_9BACT|nr:hypothetical protein FPL22_05115 [Rariglobus hedericola]
MLLFVVTITNRGDTQAAGAEFG